MESNVILTELQKNSGVFRFDSLSKCENKSVSQNNILISKTKLPGKVITVESYNRIRNNFHFEEQSLHTENEHNAAIKHLKLSKRDRITVLRYDMNFYKKKIFTFSNILVMKTKFYIKLKMEYKLYIK